MAHHRPPASTETVVIGGGIAGVTTAYYLAREGVPVVLCEKGRVAAEQSSRNWGWVRKQGRDPRELPGAILSLRLWEELDRELPGQTGFVRGGIAYLARDEARLEAFERWLDHARLYQLDSHVLSKAKTSALVGYEGSPYIGALMTPSDARAEPRLAVPAMARAAKAHGAIIRERTAVRGLQLEAGRVTGVVTEFGTISCKNVVIAAGAWSSLFLRHHGIDLPQLHVRASVLRTGAAAKLNETAMGDGNAAIRPRLDGGYTVARSGSYTVDITPDSFRYFSQYIPVLRSSYSNMKLRVGRKFIDSWNLTRPWSDDQVSPFEKVRTLDPEPDNALLDEVMAAARQQYPQLADVDIAERWAGMIDVMPDAVPAMGPVDGLENVLIATGFSGHGFGFGPAAGYLMAELICGKETSVDLAPFRMSRFSDGQRLAPYDL